ncbi:MAG: polyprenol monophosphomannose synthase [Pirellulales bacterium]|nr:polyprenol monophosphomannose synthase [Pirellulales bacterium]
MSEAEKTLVTVATYNEMENLPRLVEEIFRYLPEADILVIDDDSPDGTGRWCDRQRAENPRLHCLHRSGKLGLGTAIVAGMRYAVERGYRYVLNMDADFSHHPKYLPALLAGMDPQDGESVDVMIGSRYVPGGGVEGWPLKRRLMSRAVNLYARRLLGLRPKDCSGGLRCYRVETLARLDFDSIRSRGYSFQEEVLWRLKRQGARLGETPIIFADRKLGVSKIDSGEALEALRIIFALGVENILRR